MEALQHCIDELFKNTQTDATSIDYVVRTDRSSLITAVVELLDSQFPNKVVLHNTFTSVASGLAIASYIRMSVSFKWQARLSIVE